VPFFVTSTKDDRVHPGHARKMAKKFEDAQLPFYYYENTDGGHSAAANQTERAKRSALEFTYLRQRLFGGERTPPAGLIKSESKLACQTPPLSAISNMAKGV
jgi:hypothetical protein